MKSLVALLDRKKKDRVNTLVQVPFPSTLSYSTAHPDGQSSVHGARRTSTPTSFLRPPQQHRVASDNMHMQRPLLSEPSTYYRGCAPAQSASYFTDSDDGTFVDPFAPSPTKLKLPSKPHHDASHHIYSRRGSEPNSASKGPPGSHIFQAPPESSGAPAVDKHKSQPGPAASPSKKGRWLRERRSLTSLLWPQQPNSPIKSVPTVPPLPSRVPERKPSLFFHRARSGSTPLSTLVPESTHTTRQSSMGRDQVQLPTPPEPQPRIIDVESENSSRRVSVPPVIISPLHTDSLDPWVCVGVDEPGDPGIPIPPSVRRRAVSVPSPLPQLTQRPPPLPGSQRPQYGQEPKVDCFSITPSESVAMRHTRTSIERRKRPSHYTHGSKSASVSVPTPARSNTSAPSGERVQPSPQHRKQLSVGTVEGSVLKSALKHRPVEPIPTRSALPAQSVKPLRICKREFVFSKADAPQLPTLSSESSLKSPHRTSVNHVSEVRTTQHCTNSSRSSLERGSLDSRPVGQRGVHSSEKPALSSVTTETFGNVMKGHGLSSSDSRSLPVLDNIWGSFISETAFGGSLPPSPLASVNVRYRAMQSQVTSAREQIGHGEIGSCASCASHCESHWKPGSAPPSLPPVIDLPPVPKAPTGLSPSLNGTPRRKKSHSSANAPALLTPPISPTEQVGPQGLDRIIATPASGDKPSNRLTDESSIGHQRLGPRLARSASSPSIRPPPSPEIVANSINPRGLSSASRRSVQHQKSRSISRSLASQSKLQCAPVPGTPVDVPPSAVDPTTPYPGTSNGTLAVPRPSVSTPREASGYVESLESSIVGVSTHVPGSGETILDKFPRGQSNRVWPYDGEKTTCVIRNQDGTEEDLGEEPLLTPPVTPAWVVHVFDMETEDSWQFGSAEQDSPSDHIPLARSGNLAQLRRQKRGDMRSVPTQFPAEHSCRRDTLRLHTEKPDLRRNKALKSTTLPTRDIL